MPRADKSWKATVRVLVLYDSRGEWRYAVYSDVGVADGVLDGLRESAALEEAQAALLARVAEATGRQYAAAWAAHEPRVWTADVFLLEP